MIYLACKDDYRPANIRSGNHAAVFIRVADRRNRTPEAGAFTWRNLKQCATTLKEAKEIAQKFFDKYPDLFGLEAK